MLREPCVEKLARLPLEYTNFDAGCSLLFNFGRPDVPLKGHSMQKSHPTPVSQDKVLTGTLGSRIQTISTSLSLSGEFSRTLIKSEASQEKPQNSLHDHRMTRSGLFQMFADRAYSNRDEKNN